MSLLQALVLGLLQGFTEFLPISSSGHLVIIPALLGWEIPSPAFDVFLHAASLIAVLLYFAKDFLEALDGLDRPGPSRRFIALLAIGTVPAAVVGAVFEKQIEQQFEHPAPVAWLLIGTGLILAGTETYARTRKQREGIEDSGLSVVEKVAVEVKWWQSLSIGAAQAVAILPGISRSGSTIGAGLLMGLSRPQAARFSFMLAVPILIGASVVKIPELGGSDIGLGSLFVAGIACLAASYLAVAGMIGYLQKRGLYPFSAYCLVAGTLAALSFLRI